MPGCSTYFSEKAAIGIDRMVTSNPTIRPRSSAPKPIQAEPGSQRYEHPDDGDIDEVEAVADPTQKLYRAANQHLYNRVFWL